MKNMSSRGKRCLFRKAQNNNGKYSAYWVNVNNYKLRFSITSRLLLVFGHCHSDCYSSTYVAVLFGRDYSRSPSRSADKGLGALLRMRALLPLARSTPSRWKRWIVTSLVGFPEWEDKALEMEEMTDMLLGCKPPKVSKGTGMKVRPACWQASPLCLIFLWKA